jgi:hypothetical protein
MKLFLALSAALCIAAGPAFADPAPAGGAAPSATTPDTPPTGAPPAPADAEKLICKSKAKTGSRFPERTCMTKAQWEELWAKSRDITSNAQVRGYRANGGGGGG